MSETDKPTISARHKKACTECRQQKAKCDKYMNLNIPCSRCRKVGAHCVISDPFKREHKRKRLSQLEREAEDLRKRIHSNHPAQTVSRLGASNATDLSRTPRSLQSSTPDTSPSKLSDPLLSSTQQFASVLPVPINARPAPVVLPATSTSGTGRDEVTAARILKGTVVEAHEIDDIFKIFFQDYAPFLPILDPTTSPNGFHEQLPLLFWVVVLVGSRSYRKNPTLFPTLADPVFETMLLSMKSNSTPVSKIQAFLLFLTWPLPALEVHFPIAGWLLHLAMQNGLHLPMASHEFARNVPTTTAETARANRSVMMMDMQRRSELWSYCILVYQRTCLQKGQPPRAMLDLVPDSGHRLCQQVPMSVAIQLKCLDIVSKCSTSIFALGVRNTSPEHERSMSILIRAHETQLNDMVSQLPPNHNTLYPIIARLQIQVFYLYKDLGGQFHDCFLRLADTSCCLIEHIKVLFDKPETYVASPFFVVNALILACVCLLRMLKSSMASKLDVERAKNYLFSGINTLKYSILDPNDIAMKCARALNHVWNSSKAFRKSDGTEYSTLRIRSRLVMSPVIDLAWWWREENHDPDDTPHGAGKTSHHHHHQETHGQDDAGTASHLLTDNALATSHRRDRENGVDGGSGSTINDTFVVGANPTEIDEVQFLSDEFLTDFEWALGNEFLFPVNGAFGDMAWPPAANSAELNQPTM